MSPYSRALVFLAERLFEDSPALRLLLPFCLGILLMECGVIPGCLVPYVAASGCAALAACIFLLCKRKRISRWLSCHTLATCAFIAITASGILADCLYYTNHTVAWPAREKLWRAVVTEPCKATERCYKITAAVEYNGHFRNVIFSAGKTMFPRQPAPGDAVRFYARIGNPHNNRTPNGFDYALWLKRHGVEGTAFCNTPVVCLSRKDSLSLLGQTGFAMRLKTAAESVRQRLAYQYRRLNLPDNRLAVLSAITLGDKSMLSKQDRIVFSKAGVSHILALSGLHLGIVTAFLLMLLRPLRFSRQSRYATTLICIAFVWAFACLTGFSVSIVRSAIMVSLFLLLSLRGEGYSSFNNVVVAALLILLASPASLMDISFQLSFLSVGALVCFMPYYSGSAVRRKAGRLRFVPDFVFVSTVAQLATAPLVAVIFGTFPIFFLVANAVVIPCAYVILIAALLFMLVSGVPFLCSVAGAVLSASTNVMCLWTSGVASLPMACPSVHLGATSCILIYTAFLFLAFWLVFRKRPFLHFFLATAALFASALFWQL